MIMAYPTSSPASQSNSVLGSHQTRSNARSRWLLHLRCSSNLRMLWLVLPGFKTDLLTPRPGMHQPSLLHQCLGQMCHSAGRISMGPLEGRLSPNKWRGHLGSREWSMQTTRVQCYLPWRLHRGKGNKEHLETQGCYPSSLKVDEILNTNFCSLANTNFLFFDEWDLGGEYRILLGKTDLVRMWIWPKLYICYYIKSKATFKSTVNPVCHIIAHRIIQKHTGANIVAWPVKAPLARLAS